MKNTEDFFSSTVLHEVHIWFAYHFIIKCHAVSVLMEMCNTDFFEWSLLVYRKDFNVYIFWAERKYLMYIFFGGRKEIF